MPQFGAVVEKAELPLSLVVSSRGETLQLRLRVRWIPRGTGAEAVLAGLAVELGWLAQDRIEPTGQRGGAVQSLADAAGGRHQD